MRKFLVPFVALSSVLLGYLIPRAPEPQAFAPAAEMTCADREPTSINENASASVHARETALEIQQVQTYTSLSNDSENNLDNSIWRLGMRLAEKCKSEFDADPDCNLLSTLSTQRPELAELTRQLAADLRSKCEIEQLPNACKWSGNFYFNLGMNDQLLDMDRAGCHLDASYLCDDLVAQLGYQNRSEEEQFEAAKLGCEIQTKFDEARGYCASIINHTYSPELFKLLARVKVDGMPLLRKGIY